MEKTKQVSQHSCCGITRAALTAQIGHLRSLVDKDLAAVIREKDEEIRNLREKIELLVQSQRMTETHLTSLLKVKCSEAPGAPTSPEIPTLAKTFTVTIPVFAKSSSETSTEQVVVEVPQEISQDLLKKLMSQNGRLKKVIRDILAYKNITTEDYLDKLEQRDKIDALHYEINVLRKKLDAHKPVEESQQMQTIIDLKKRNVELEKALIQHKAISIAFSEQYENLRKEIDTANAPN